MSTTTAAEKLLLQMVDDYTQKEIAPQDMPMDAAGDFPAGFMEKLTATGFLGLMLPQEFGGAGFGPEITAMVLNHIARGNASTAVTLEGHFKTIDQLLKYGTPALQQQLLPTAIDRIFAFSMTEASGGSNPMSISSTATREGNHWVLNGDKIMITNGGLAEVYCVLVKTAPTELSVFVVDQDMPGFSFGKREDFIGLRGTPVGEIVMDHIVVDDDHLLGNLGDGGLIGDSAHDDARVLMGAVLTGIMEHELKIATDYAKERKTGDQPLTALQVTQRKIADMAIRKETTKLLYQQAAHLKALGQPYSELAAMAKAHGSRAAVSAGDDALQILASYGYSREYPVEHLIRDARALEIAEGTVEKMRSAIALAEFNH